MRHSFKFFKERADACGGLLIFVDFDLRLGPEVKVFEEIFGGLTDEIGLVAIVLLATDVVDAVDFATVSYVYLFLISTGS